jgi:hypothetical protein
MAFSSPPEMKPMIGPDVGPDVGPQIECQKIIVVLQMVT